jgi:carboxypeptidase Taq
MTAYSKLCSLASEIALIDSMANTLGWDQETGMPPKALDYRAKQMGYLSGKSHALFTSVEFGKTLSSAEDELTASAGAVPAANLREWRRRYDRNTKLPQELIEEFSQVSSHAKHAWVEARAKSDFSLFSPHLEKLLALTLEKADRLSTTETVEAYDALLDEFEPGARAADISSLFETLRPQLAQIAKAAVEKSAAVPVDRLAGDYPIALQQQLNREIAESIGFDFDAGRIDTTAHPFCTGLTPGDVRLTTRYDERDFTSSLFGVLHEAGHGMYEQGLPEEEFGYPSGAAISLGIHESQSRLWENHVGRSRSFWLRWLPRAQELFPALAKVGLDEFLAWLHRAEFSFIRVEADEATYDLHILLRFSIERRLLRGELKVTDVPEAWNAEFSSLFGMTPPDAAHGCLQDIHWSMGAIGYFPTYTLGNLNAAQLYRAAQKDPAVAAGISKADYAPLLTWLRQRVHQHGSVLLPGDLMLAATGQGTEASYHLEHLRTRFL